MLDSLIGSKTRIKLLLKFFLNPETTAYLRGPATEFNESTNLKDKLTADKALLVWGSVE